MESNDNAVVTLEGVRIVFSERGTGAAIRRGAQILVDYECRHKQGQLLDSNPCFAVVCGVQDVVQGLDEALMTMREGDRATVEVAAEKAYGDAPLVFRLHVTRVSNIPQTLEELNHVVSTRTIPLGELLHEAVTKKGALTITKMYEAVHAQTIAQEHLTLSALMQDYEDTFCSIIDDSPSAAHSQFFSRSVVYEAPECCIAEASVHGRRYLCATLLLSEGSAIASSFWSTLLARPCNVVIAIGPCVLPAADDAGARGLRLGQTEVEGAGVLEIAAVDEIGPGLRRYTLVSTENADRRIHLCWFSDWEAGSIPSNNNAWLRFWSAVSELLAAEESISSGPGYVCVCEVAEQQPTAFGEDSSRLLTRTSCLAIVDSVVRQATSVEVAEAGEVNVARAYIDVSKTVRAGVTQAQYKFIYKAIRQAVKAKA